MKKKKKKAKQKKTVFLNSFCLCSALPCLCFTFSMFAVQTTYPLLVPAIFFSLLLLLLILILIVILILILLILTPSSEHYILTGNHDIGNRPTAASIDMYKGRFGSDYFRFWCGGVQCLVFNR